MTLGLRRATAGSTPHPFGRKSFAVIGPLALGDVALYPIPVRQPAVPLPASFSAALAVGRLAVRSGPCDQVPRGLSPPCRVSCWAHQKKASRRTGRPRIQWAPERARPLHRAERARRGRRVGGVPLVELDVAAPGTGAAQIAHGQIAALEPDPEEVIAAGLAVVGHPDAEVAAVTGVGAVRPADVAGPVVHEHVPRDAGRLDVQAVAVVEVIQVPPESAVLHPSAHTEVGHRARRGPDDPASAGHEIARRLLTSPAPAEDPPAAEKYQTRYETQQNAFPHGRPHQSHG